MTKHLKINISNLSRIVVIVLTVIQITTCVQIPTEVRKTQNFNNGWKFYLGDINHAHMPAHNDSAWRVLNLPHDWSIEGEFSEANPATPGGGALPGGIGWYRKSFILPESEKNRLIFLTFDGVYRDSEVWINGTYLGKRPYGYISFQYELTPYLNYGTQTNTIAIKVDNSQQPNSRWYTGSGIYRNVWLTSTEKLHIPLWGTFVSTPEVDHSSAKVIVKTMVRNATEDAKYITLKTEIFDKNNEKVSAYVTKDTIKQEQSKQIIHEVNVKNPGIWSIENPELYTTVTTISCEGKVWDYYKTPFGIRTFYFDSDRGFYLNGKHVKIKGVCNHHDLGCLGTAVNTRAIERQLEILKEMGCNGIRTAHNPPAPELLTLCDQMGFVVMDEAFDVWKKLKTEFDYHLDFDQWHIRDMSDLVLRDRNHPSVIIWSIGNELMEQWDKQDSSGLVIAQELKSIIENLDGTRPVTAGCNDIDPKNPLIKSGSLDIIGYNYNHEKYSDFLNTYPAQALIATETQSALATRGQYDMPSDSIRRWPPRWDIPLKNGNQDYTCSSYDNCSTPWGSTHRETWPLVNKYDFVSGMFIWTGFDYLGEPTPYGWPARSSYFGIIDLAGYPKDAFYLFQSEWSDKNVLHIFPHWNWEEGQRIDVWAYTNCSEVELFLNNRSQGKKKKSYQDLYLVWQLEFTPGTIKAVGRISGDKVLTKEIKTALAPSKIRLEADRNLLKGDGQDLSFVTASVLDRNGTLVPFSDNLIHFKVNGEGKIVGVDNGYQASHEPFKADYRKAYNGKCLVVIQSCGDSGEINVAANSDGLEPANIVIGVD